MSTRPPPSGRAAATHNEARQILTVGALARAARVLLEERFALIWVEGEISNLAQPRSGHWYFTLKDADAQIRCAMFAGRNRTVRFPVRNGLKVLLRGRISLYEARGDFQIIAEHLEPAGEGALRAAYERLKLSLEAEGLFATERKRPLPARIQKVAVISSLTGAALRDFLHVVERRFAALSVIVLPVAVQGDAAGPEIVAALGTLPSLSCDVAVLTRGGGSLEDLWAFNLETVARAVAAAPIPVVSAVGHQTDFTIADFVADVRAPTPSAAAELITPDTHTLTAQVASLATRLTAQLRQDLRYQASNLARLRGALVDPRARLQQQMQRADDFEQRLQRAMRLQRQQLGARLSSLWHRLQQRTAQQQVEQSGAAVNQLAQRLGMAAEQQQRNRAQLLAATARTLQAVSPLQTLSRGYAAVTSSDGAVLDDAATIAPGTTLLAYLKRGQVTATVTATDPDATLLASFDDDATSAQPPGNTT